MTRDDLSYRPIAARLENGSRVAVLGGGPAGSLSAYFLLSFARQMDLNIGVDIYEPRDFAKSGPAGCNMCGGIVSESLVQALAAEGINLPQSVVQRGIDAYVLHTDTETVRIGTPLNEKRIAAVHRGGGPRGAQEIRWGGLDGYLLNLARDLGARVVPVRIGEAGWDRGRPFVFQPAYSDIAHDNRFGRLIFAIVDAIKAFGPLLRGVMAMTAKEQLETGPNRRMSIVLWDMFTGSASYREIIARTLDPRFLGRFFWESARAAAGGLRAEERRLVMDEGALGREYSDGDVICRQGERGDRMFVIQAGRVSVVHQEAGLEAVVGELGTGDIFGEMAIFDQQPRSASVRANGKTRVLTLDKHAFLSRVNEDPSLTHRMLEEMSQRIRSLDAEVSRLRGAAPPG